MRNHPAQLIAKKRDAGDLDDGEIIDLVEGVVDGSLGDAQLGAFLMAVCCNGMTVAETRALTLAMRDSGRVLRHEGVHKPMVDKHSTGGVGDKVSLLLAPLVAAAGVAVPMISGRGLGHTGGTIDKLQSIPGYRTDLSIEEFQSVLATCGYVMAGASAEIAPADRRMYAVRDVSGTVESIPLITSSILAKKLAEGIDGLVMDVKCGRAAFMRQQHDAVDLMERIVETGRAAGISVTALLTDMDLPLGRAIGNALEVVEILDCLDGKGPDDVVELTLALGAEMLVLAGKAGDPPAALEILRPLLQGGAAKEMFRLNLAEQGGAPQLLEDRSTLGSAPVVMPVESTRSGYVADVDPMALGLAVVDLGGGRRQPTDHVDPSVGVVLDRHLGDRVEVGEPLAWVHAADGETAAAAVDIVHQAMPVGDEQVKRGPLVLKRANGV